LVETISNLSFLDEFLKEKLERINHQIEGYSQIEIGENPFKIVKNILGAMKEILKELGLWAFVVYLKEILTKKMFSECMNNFKASYNLIDENLINDTLDFIRKIEAYFRYLIDEKRLLDDEELEPKNIIKNSCNKLSCLLQVLNDAYEFEKNSSLTTTTTIKGYKFHSIIFVERKSIAEYIDRILKALSSLEEWNFIRSDFVTGNSQKRDMNTNTQVRLFV
jgi:hypothetical protein